MNFQILKYTQSIIRLLPHREQAVLIPGLLSKSGVTI